MGTVKCFILAAVICFALASRGFASTIVSDDFDNTATSPGGAPDSSLWSTYNYNSEYQIGEVDDSGLGGENYGTEHNDILRIAQASGSGPNAGAGLYSNNSFEVANGAVTIDAFLWRTTSSSRGGDAYIAVTPNDSGEMGLNTFFTREVTAATYVQAGTINAYGDTSRYYGYNSTTGDYGSMTVSDRGVNVEMDLTDVAGVVDATVYVTPYGGSQITLYSGATALSPTQPLYVAAFHVDDQSNIANEDPGFVDSIDATQAVAVPEPASSLTVIGLCALTTLRRARKAPRKPLCAKSPC
jgi:hypothetical protein